MAIRHIIHLLIAALTLIYVFVLGIQGSALADGNVASQYGNNHEADIAQDGDLDEAYQSQYWDGNFSDIAQSTATTWQYGYGNYYNTAAIEQAGSGNWAEQYQIGAYNDAYIDQIGDYNRAEQYQSGKGNTATTWQYGYGNYASSITIGISNVSSQIQNGNGLSSGVTLVGNDIVVSVIQGP